MRAMRAITTTVSETVAAPPRRVFDAARGLDIPATMRRHGPLPGVASIAGHMGPYSAPGEVKLLTLTDGSSVREELTAFAPENSYAYRLDGFTGPFAALVARGDAEWRFSAVNPGETRIEWTYGFTPKSAATAPAVWLVVKGLWPGYMRAALRRLKTEIEGVAGKR